MSGGYPSGSNDPLIALTSEIRKLWAAIRDLSRPTGTSVASLVDQVQAALANINATVQTAIAANSYTKSEIDTKIASPGDITPGNVTASGNLISSGQVQSNGSPLKSLPSHNYNMNVGSWVAGWIDGDGTFGTSASSVLLKTGLVQMAADDVAKLLTIPAYWGRYVWDDADSPLKVFVLAEDVHAAGFGPDVAPTTSEDMLLTMPDGSPILDDAGKQCVIPAGGAWTVNYSQLVVPLLAGFQDLCTRVTALEAKA